MYIKRYLNIKEILSKKSLFLFGPRQTGKSSLIKNELPLVKSYNLLDSNTYLMLSQNPKLIEQQLTKEDEIIVIDEIQKLPSLLDEVHLLIETKNIKFLLTGSSARKLRRGGVNLLGGRARSRVFHSLVYSELKGEFDLNKALDIGTIPSIYFSDAPYEDLKAYTGDYLQEEIASEARVRNIPAFSRFLQVAGLCNGKMINYQNISSDSQVPNTTVQEYFQILRDTLLAFDVPAWKHSLKRKPITTSKFYFFDVGIVRSLQKKQKIYDKTSEYGEAFETFMAHELKAYTDYLQKEPLTYWRSKSNYEVDFILDNRIAVEIKAKEVVTERDIKGLYALKEENLLQGYCVVSLEKVKRVINGITIYPWRDFLEKLWLNEL